VARRGAQPDHGDGPRLRGPSASARCMGRRGARPDRVRATFGRGTARCERTPPGHCQKDDHRAETCVDEAGMCTQGDARHAWCAREKCSLDRRARGSRDALVRFLSTNPASADRNRRAGSDWGAGRREAGGVSDRCGEGSGRRLGRLGAVQFMPTDVTTPQGREPMRRPMLNRIGAPAVSRNLQESQKTPLHTAGATCAARRRAAPRPCGPAASRRGAPG
jgi:hypothetical protein